MTSRTLSISRTCGLSRIPRLSITVDHQHIRLSDPVSTVADRRVESFNALTATVVIAYSSRALSKPERNYDTTRRELLAIVYGFKTYKQHLLGRHFVIRTDHSALQWLRTATFVLLRTSYSLDQHPRRHNPGRTYLRQSAYRAQEPM